jgi:hypothetical protein
MSLPALPIPSNLLNIRGGKTPLVVHEAPFPTPTTPEQFKHLMDLIYQMETERLGSQKALHEAAAELNALLAKFPAGLVAQFFGFKPWNYRLRKQGRRPYWHFNRASKVRDSGGQPRQNYQSRSTSRHPKTNQTKNHSTNHQPTRHSNQRVPRPRYSYRYAGR